MWRKRTEVTTQDAGRDGSITPAPPWDGTSASWFPPGLPMPPKDNVLLPQGHLSQRAPPALDPHLQGPTSVARKHVASPSISSQERPSSPATAAIVGSLCGGKLPQGPRLQHSPDTTDPELGPQGTPEQES